MCVHVQHFGPNGIRHSQCEATTQSVYIGTSYLFDVCLVYPRLNCILMMCFEFYVAPKPQGYHTAGQDWLPIRAKQGGQTQYQDWRPPGKTPGLLLEGVLVRTSVDAHRPACMG